MSRFQPAEIGAQDNQILSVHYEDVIELFDLSQQELPRKSSTLLGGTRLSTIDLKAVRHMSGRSL